MMNNITNVLARRDGGPDSTHVALIITLVLLFIIASLCIGALLVLRSMRRARKAASEQHLPLYEKRQSNHPRMTITTNRANASVIYSEKRDLRSPSSPSSPVPEIRITFPDEVDESGRHQQGRVVVVRVGEHSVGLEPVGDLPPYSSSNDDDRFDSLDLDRMGGLKEKDDKYYS